MTSHHVTSHVTTVMCLFIINKKEKEIQKKRNIKLRKINKRKIKMLVSKCIITTLSSNPCNFHTLSLNNLANSSANVPSVIVTKCIILDNLSQTTKIISFLATNSNFVIKSTIRCVHSFSSTSLSFNFPTGAFVLFFILWHILQLSTYLLTFLITLGHQ